MNSIYRLQSDELMDETEYLMSSPANRLHLETAIKNIENQINLVTVPLQSIKSGSIQGRR